MPSGTRLFLFFVFLPQQFILLLQKIGDRIQLPNDDNNSKDTHEHNAIYTKRHGRYSNCCPWYPCEYAARDLHELLHNLMRLSRWSRP